MIPLVKDGMVFEPYLWELAKQLEEVLKQLEDRIEAIERENAALRLALDEMRGEAKARLAERPM